MMSGFKIFSILVLFVLLLPVCFASDSVEIGSSSDLLEINKVIGDVKKTLTKNDLDLLKSSQITTSFGVTDINQFLRFEDDNSEDAGKVVFEEDERDRVGHYLHWNQVVQLFQYELEFENGLQSSINSTTNKLDDFLNKELFILGEKLVIDDAFIVNNKLTLELSNSNKNIVFNNIELSSFSNFESAKVIVDSEVIEDSAVSFIGNLINNDEELILNNIYYNLAARAVLGDIYIKEDAGLRENLKEPEGLLTNNWDITYEGLKDTGVTYVSFNPAGNREYDLEFTNQEDFFYKTPLISNNNGIWRYGDKNVNLWFKEADGDVYPVGLEDYFIVSDCLAAPYNALTGTDNSCNSRVFKWESIDLASFKLTFDDLKNSVLEIPFDETTGIAEINVNGVKFKIELDVSNNFANNQLRIDHNGDSIIDGSSFPQGIALIAIQGKGLLALGNQDSSHNFIDGFNAVPLDSQGNPASEINFQLITLQKELVNAAFDEVVNIGLETRIISSQDRVGILPTTPLAGNTAMYFSGMFELDTNPEFFQAMSGFGVFFEKYVPSLGGQAEDLTIVYPLSQKSVSVFVKGDFVYDITPPVITISAPANNAVISQNSVLVSVSTNEPAVCSAKVCKNTNTCNTLEALSSSNSLLHSKTFSSLVATSTNEYYKVFVSCTDLSNNQNSKENTFTVDLNTCIIPSDGMVITESTDFCSGTYDLSAGIIIDAEDIVLDCNGAVLDGNGRKIGIHVKQDEVIIKNCEISNYYKGIFLESSYNDIIDNNISFYSLNSNGIYFESDIVGNKISNNVISGDSSYGNNAGINIRYSFDNIIQDNDISECEIGISMVSSSNNIISENKISETENKEGVGIYLYDSDNNAVTNNILIDNPNKALVLADSSSNLISQNNIKDNGGGGSSSPTGGIWLYPNSINNIISNNRFNNNYEFNLFNAQQNEIDAEKNYWGTTNQLKIENQIHDYFDEADFGIVDFCPYLDSSWNSAKSISCTTEIEKNILENSDIKKIKSPFEMSKQTKSKIDIKDRLEKVLNFKLKEREKFSFLIKEKEHSFEVKNIIDNNKITFVLSSEPIYDFIGLNQVKTYDLNNDGIFDVSVYLKSIENDVAKLKIERLFQKTSSLSPVSICFSILGVLLVIGSFVYFILKR